MRDIQDPLTRAARGQRRLLAGHHLKSPGQANQAQRPGNGHPVQFETGAETIGTERLDRGDGRRGVAVLDRAHQRRRRQIVERQPRALVTPALCVEPPVKILAGHNSPRAKALDCGIHAARHVVSAEHGRTPCPENSGLLRTDQLQGLAEPIAVIETDRAHHCDIGVNQVGGIQPAAETHFEDHYIDGVVGEHNQRGKCVELEESQRGFSARRLDSLEG